VPKWIRYFLARDSGLASQVLRIFIYEIQKQLKISAGKNISDDVKVGAISFIQRFGSALNLHIHYHCVVMDGIFCEVAEGLLQFHEVDDLSVDDSDAVQTRVRINLTATELLDKLAAFIPPPRRQSRRCFFQHLRL